MTNGFFTEAQIRSASQCWGSPWRVAEREEREETVLRNFYGQEVAIVVLREHPMPKRLVRLHPNEMQAIAVGIPVKIGRDVLS